ncbi:MAG: tetratricopeptide repeat protein, partial [Verrucomicrobiales bacterium]|nr:tetratricopeptide repeat protein [Verrucomicrobiales bacterium]
MNVNVLLRLSVLPWLALALGLLGCSKEDRLAGHLEKADSAFAKREFEVAKIEYINALRIQPTNSTAVLRLGKIFFEQGQLMPAFAFLQKGRSLFPEDVEALEHMSVIYAGMPGVTNRTRFRQELNELLQRNPTNETGLLLLGSVTRTPEELSSTQAKLAQLRAQRGDHPLYHLVEATLALNGGDRAATEASFQKALALGPNTAAVHQLYANFLNQQGRRAEMEQHLKQAYTLSAPHGPARLAWARFLFASGRLDEARAVLDELNSKAPERTAAWVARAELALVERKPEDAEKALARAAAQAPADIDVIRTYAQLRLVQNHPDQAIRELERAEKVRPDSEALQFQLARTHLANRDAARAIVSLEKAVGLRPDFAEAALLLSQLHLARGAHDQAITVLRDSIKHSPNYEPSYLQLARAQSAASRPEDAFNALQVARSRFTNSYEAPLQQGMVLRQLNRAPDARKAFEDALRLSPTNSLAAFEQLVQLDVAATNTPAALRRIQERIAREANNPLLWLVQCEVLLHDGKLEEAERSARKVVELNPESIDGFMSLSRVLARSEGRQKDALQELENLLAKKPDDMGALILSAEIYQQQKDYARAAERYERALKSRSANPYLHNNLAYLQAEHLGRLDDARRTAERARELAPEDPAIADTLGWILFRSGQYPEALRILTEASARLSAHHEAQFHLGMAHYMMGNEAEARQALGYAVRAPSPFAGIETARESLALLGNSSDTLSDDQVRSLEKRRTEFPKDVISLSRLAGAYVSRGNYEGAKSAYEAVLGINPKSSVALARLALLSATQFKDPTRAAELLRSARAIAPNDPDVMAAAGKIALAAGDLSGASGALSEAVRQFPQRHDLALDLATANALLGRINEARSALGNAAAANAPVAAQAKTLLGALDGLDTASPAAAASIDALLKADPNQPIALAAYGSLSLARGQTQPAIQAYRKVLEKFPEAVPALRGLAVIQADSPAGSDDAAAYDAAV